MTKMIVGVIALCGLCAFACNKKEEASASGGAIGVQECDDYIKQYQACIDKMPAASKSTAETGFKVQVDAWKASAATAEGKAALKTGCKATLDALATNPLCK
ncbi:MAG: hypothetical protein KF819_25635 [Labilithrix sp.]|nr:hypothetical protein [Labilithrix sp.]